MKYTSQYAPRADKQALLKDFKGKKVSELPTPAFVVDRDVLKSNCTKMLQKAERLHCDFRAHVKTHKTVEGTEYQLGTGSLTTDKTIVSTLTEAWSLAPLCKEGKIKDLLFSLPVLQSRLDELSEFSKCVESLRLMLDNEEQFKILADFCKKTGYKKKWSVFIKVNMGSNRAGFVLKDLDHALATFFNSPDYSKYISIYGFYCHAGHSYGSDTEEQCESYLIQEINSASEACKKALAFDPELKLQMSVGATPTAHSSELLELSTLGKLYGNLELHAGNYPFCDLQQMATHCVGKDSVSCRVVGEVVSSYPGRGEGPGEQLCNMGVLVMSKETSHIAGFGLVDDEKYSNWKIGRLSQEHGILTVIDSSKETPMIPLGTRLSVIPQHSCITAANFAWYYVVEKGVVVDIWVPYRGW